MVTRFLVVLALALAACGERGEGPPEMAEDGGESSASTPAKHEAPADAASPPPSTQEAKGWAAYLDELAPHLDASWLDEAERARVRGYHLALTHIAELEAGKVPAELLETARAFAAHCAAKEATWKKRNEGTFALAADERLRRLRELCRTSFDALQAAAAGRAATSLAVVEDEEFELELQCRWRRDHRHGSSFRVGETPEERERRNRDEAERRRKEWFDSARLTRRRDLQRFLDAGPPRLTTVLAAPWAFCVAEDDGWDETREAESAAVLLAAVERALTESLGPLPDRDDIVRTALLVRCLPRPRRSGFALGHGGHYDPADGLLVLFGDGDYRQRLRLGASMLLDLLWPDRRPPSERARWVRRGIAASLAGADRVAAAEAEWRYDFATLPASFELMDLKSAPWRLQDLLAAKEDGAAHPLDDLGAGLLVHFLRDVVIEGDRVVLGPAAAGRVPNWRSGWERFVREAVAGRDAIADFRRAFEVEDEESFAALSVLFERYQEFVLRKERIGQVARGRLIPWSAFVNRRGVAVGEPSDDALPPR